MPNISEEELREQLKQIVERHDRRLDGLDLNTANFVEGQGSKALVNELIGIITSRDKAIELRSKIEERKNLRFYWTDDGSNELANIERIKQLEADLKSIEGGK